MPYVTDEHHSRLLLKLEANIKLNNALRIEINILKDNIDTQKTALEMYNTKLIELKNIGFWRRVFNT